MSDTRELLRRGVGDYVPEPDGFERVLRRRDRKQRNRRVGAVIVTVLIVAVGAALFRSQFRTDTVPANPNDAPPPAWIVFSATDIVPGSGFADRSSTRDLYVVREGVEARVIAGSKGDRTDQFCPAIAPDGTHFAYLSLEGSGFLGQYGGAAQLVMAPLNSDGTLGPPTFQRSIHPHALNPCPRWAPDSSRIAVIDKGGVLTVDTGGDVTPIEGAAGVDDLTWSPDGTQLAIRQGSTVSVVGEGPPRKVATGLDGGDVNQLAWSPFGLAIGTSEPAGGGNPSKAATFLRIVDPSNGDSRDVPLGQHGWVDDVTWLADGRILYTDSSFAAKVVDPAGTGGPSLLGNDAGPAVLAPDGRSVVFMSANDKGWAVFTMPLDGGPPQQLTPYSWGAEYADFDW